MLARPYDLAGRLTQTTGPSSASQTNSYFNTGRIYQTVDTAGTSLNSITGTFGYDAAGNRTYEGYAGTVWQFSYQYAHTVATTTLQNATISYDELGRITSFVDKDSVGTTRITVNTSYDLAGNVRRVQSTYPNIAYPQYGSLTTDNWYRYDSMNRMVVANGQFSGGQIVRGGLGVDITYDLAGQRKTVTKDAGLTGYAWTWVWYPDFDPNTGHELTFPQEGYNGDYQWVAVGYTGARRETYTYRADGYLSDVYFAETGYTDNGDGTVSSTGVLGSDVLRARNNRDAMGRITEYLEYDNAGGITQDRYSIVYNARGQITSETLSQKKNESGVNNTYLTYTTNSYNTDGTLAWSVADNYKNGSDSGSLDTRTSYTYNWWDDARVSTSVFDSDTDSSSNALWNSTYYYDGMGRLASVNIADGRPRTVSFASAPGGQVLSRIERSAASSNPAEYHYFVDGVQVGDLDNNGNNNPDTIDYAQTLVTRNWTANPVAAPFRWNTTGGVTEGNFGGSGYDPLNPLSNGSQGSNSTYTTRDGDTLAGIAAQLWGDSSLWYMLAEANGMSGSEQIVGGRGLIVPNKVTNIHNNASTYQVYDPNEALGDLSPTAAKPPKKANKCGAFGAILLVAVAVAVTAVTYGALGGAALSGLSAIGAGAVAGAAGSIASQVVGVATGLQDKFSWKGVALAALGGAIGGGVGQVLGKGAMAGSQFVGDAVRGAVGSALTQGVAVVTGLQGKFDWVGVAAAGLGAAVTAGIANKSFNITNGNFAHNLTGYIQQGVSSMAGAIANAATRTLGTGSDFGDNMLAALPDVIGATIGNAIGDHVQIRGSGGTRSASGNGSQATDAAKQVGNNDVMTPVAGVGGGQSAAAGDDDGNTIVVTANRHGAAQSVVNGAIHANESAPVDLTSPTYGFRNATPQSRAENRRFVQDGVARMRADQSLSPDARDAGIAQLEENGAYWDAKLAISEGIQALFGSGGFQLLSPDLLSFRNGQFDLLTSDFLSINSNRVNFLTKDFLHVGSDGLNFLTENFLHIGNDGVNFLTNNFLHIGDDGVKVLGPYGIAIGPETKIFGYTVLNSSGFTLEAPTLDSSTPAAPKPYSNPRNRPDYAPGQVETVWNNAMDANGNVFDPNTGERLSWDRSRSRAGQWDMGHMPGHEYRTLHERYMTGAINLEQFLSEYRNPSNYHPESPSSNRSHRYERH